MNKEGQNFDDDTWTHDGDRETFLVSNNPLGGKTGTNPSTLVEKRNNPNAKKKTVQNTQNIITIIQTAG